MPFAKYCYLVLDFCSIQNWISETFLLNLTVLFMIPTWISRNNDAADFTVLWDWTWVYIICERTVYIIFASLPFLIPSLQKNQKNKKPWKSLDKYCIWFLKNLGPRNWLSLIYIWKLKKCWKSPQFLSALFIFFIHQVWPYFLIILEFILLEVFDIFMSYTEIILPLISHNL